MIVSHALLLLLITGGTSLGGEDPPALTVGGVTPGVIDVSCPVVETPRLLDRHAWLGPAHGRRYRIEVETAGIYHVRLRSHFFDPYLVFHRADGTVQQDDDGLFGVQSELRLALDAGKAYFLDACALDGRHGSFEIELRRGEPPARTLAQELTLALEHAREGLQLVEAMSRVEGVEVAYSLENLARLHMRRGDYRAALPLFERSLRIRKQNLGEGHVLTAASTANLGLVHWRLGNFREAGPLLHSAVIQTRKAKGDRHVFYALCLNNLALLARSQGRLEEARRYLQRALEVELAEGGVGEKHWATATTRNILGRVLRDLDNFPAAADQYMRAFRTRNELKETRDLLTTLDHLGSLLTVWSVRVRDSGENPRKGQARKLLERALSVRTRELGDHPETASSHNSLGLFFLYHDDLPEARRHLEQALGMRRSLLGDRHPTTASSLANLAALSRREGQLESAEKLYREVLEIRETILGPDHPDTARTRKHLATVLADRGKREEARRESHRSLRATEKGLRRILASLSEAERIRLAVHQQSHLVVLLGLQPDSSEPAREIELYESVLHWKGQVSRALMMSRESLRRSITPEQQTRLDELLDVQAELSSAITSPDIRREDPGRYLRDLRQRHEKLEQELWSSQSLVLPPAVSWGEVRRALPEDAAAVDFLVHRRYVPAVLVDGKVVERGKFEPLRVTAWTFSRDSTHPLRHDLGPADALEEKVTEFLDDLISRRSLGGKRVIERRQSLRSLLWDPLAPSLDAASLIFVSPDRFLGRLPLATLQRRDGSFFIEHQSFVYQSDLTQLVHIVSRPPRSAASPHLLGVADVDYEAAPAVPTNAELGSSFEGQWDPLASTGREWHRIEKRHQRTFGSARRLGLVQGEATESRLKAECAGFHVLHIATHGYFNPTGMKRMWESLDGDDELRSAPLAHSDVVARRNPGLLTGLVLAGANVPSPPGQDDGLLTAEEVGWLPLQACELVVLSACETGLGTERGAEGTMSLARAFHQAGARSVISSLWEVRDGPTSDLTVAFYTKWWRAKQSRIDALRAAQLQLLEEGDRLQRLPSSWGAFFLSGDWR